ncbi:magnesium and cobalt transport protein CorA [Reichenbachiella sp. 5M10]|nr:magnesium and cobalt transport protein CorA [Reichenbachiella sp. 5M10]
MLKKGAAPGSLIFVGQKKMDKPLIQVIRFDEKVCEEYDFEKVEEIFEKIDAKGKSWVNIDGVHDEKLIEMIGSRMNMDLLLLEDILDTSQRPKCEDYNGNLYVVLRMIHYDEAKDVTVSEQFSMVLGENYLFTFQEVPGDVLNPVRERMRKPKARIRNRTMDYLAYALLDAIVDNYIFAIEQFGEKIDQIDEEVLINPDKSVLEKINFYKREINYLRKAIRPVREAVIQFEKSDFIDKRNKHFLKDLLDHVTIATESIETYRELLSDQLNIYHTSMSNKLNEIMRLLTIYTLIFSPLTLIVGIYGMNFKFMPELDYQYSYPIIWGVMVLITGSMFVYFKKREWL